MSGVTATYLLRCAAMNGGTKIDITCTFVSMLHVAETIASATGHQVDVFRSSGRRIARIQGHTTVLGET